VVTISNQNGVSFSAPVKGVATVTGQRVSGQFRVWDILPDGRFIGVASGGTGDDAGSAPELRVVLNWAEEVKHKLSGSRRVPSP
jgi:hypothetical protein